MHRQWRLLTVGISRMIGALNRLTAGRGMTADSAQVQPCECQVCVSVRAARGTHAAQRLDPESKSNLLLREWLFPEQLVQYEAMGAFEVIGSETGKRYRIQEGRQQN